MVPPRYESCICVCANMAVTHSFHQLDQVLKQITSTLLSFYKYNSICIMWDNRKWLSGYLTISYMMYIKYDLMFAARQTDASYTSHYNSTTVAVGKSHMIVVDTLYVAVKNYT